MKIKAIQTQYRGYKFRSRLEARWAVFFDALGVRWDYETEGYMLPSGPYLPDFYLPEIAGGVWIEVKSDAPLAKNSKEQKMLEELVIETQKDGMIVRGVPLEGMSNDDPHYYDPLGAEDGSAYWMHIYHEPIDGYRDSECGADGPYLFCVCPQCFKVGIEFDGRGARVCRSNCSRKDSPVWDNALSRKHPDKAYSWFHPKILNAAKKARSARFEHGETPK